jgi:hypothetical protein
VPPCIVTTETNLGATDIPKYRTQWRQLYGGSQNGNKIAVMPMGMDFKEVQQTNADLQYVEATTRGKAQEQE